MQHHSYAHGAAGNSCLAGLYNMMSTPGYEWPEAMNTAVLSDRLAAMRVFLGDTAISASDGFTLDLDRAGTEQMISIMLSLFEGAPISQDLCLMASPMFQKVVNVIQYVPGEGSLHVTRYGGAAAAIGALHVSLFLCVELVVVPMRTFAVAFMHRNVA